MAFRYEINGQLVEFEKEPTESDIDEAAAQLGQPSEQEIQKKDNSLISVMASGPVAMGSNEEDRGALIASLLSGATQGKLREFLEHPVASVMGGGSTFTGAEAGIDLLNSKVIPQTALLPHIENPYRGTGAFPEASTAAGKLGQLGIETAIPVISGAEVGSVKSLNMPQKQIQTSSMLDEMLNASKADANFKIKLADESLQMEKVRLASVRREDLTRLKEAKNILKADIDSSADRAVLKAREAYVPFAKEISAGYGADWEKALSGKKININDYYEVLKRTAQEEGLFTKARLSPDEIKFLSYVEEMGNQVPKQESTTVIDDLLGTVRKENNPEPIFKPLSEVDLELKGFVSKSYGKEHGYGEHIKTRIRKNIGDILPEEMKLVNAKWKNQLQMKHEFYDAVQPFDRSGNYDTTKGQSIFRRYVESKVNPKALKPDEERFLTQLNKKLGGNLLSELDKKANLLVEIENKSKLVKINEQSNFEAMMDAVNTRKAQLISKLKQEEDLLTSMINTAKAREARRSIYKKLAIGAASTVGVGALARLGFEIPNITASK